MKIQELSLPCFEANDKQCEFSDNKFFGYTKVQGNTSR